MFSFIHVGGKMYINEKNKNMKNRCNGIEEEEQATSAQSDRKKEKAPKWVTTQQIKE